MSASGRGPTVGWLGRLYVANWLYRRTRLAGALALAFHRSLFPGFRVGPGARIWGWFHVQLAEGGEIVIGDDLHMVSASPRSWLSLNTRCQLTAGPNGRIEIGRHVGLNGTTISCKRSVRIGDYCMIAPNTTIMDTDFHVPWPAKDRWTSKSDPFDEPVIIGTNVWIGMNVTVLKGVTIGDNALIAAGSVVTGDIPPNCIAAGNPARVVKEQHRADEA